MRKSMLVMVALGVMVVAGGCAGEKKDTAPQVAGLSSAGSAPKASAPAKAERPRERLDGTPEDYEAMLGPYNKCLKDRGAKSKSELGENASKADVEKLEKENKFCEENFGPLPAWERDPANPKHKDFNRAVVKCLTKKGIKASLDDQGEIQLGGDIDANNISAEEQASVAKGLDEMPKCEQENVAAGN